MSPIVNLAQLAAWSKLLVTCQSLTPPPFGLARARVCVPAVLRYAVCVSTPPGLEGGNTVRSELPVNLARPSLRAERTGPPCAFSNGPAGSGPGRLSHCPQLQHWTIEVVLRRRYEVLLPRFPSWGCLFLLFPFEPSGAFLLFFSSGPCRLLFPRPAVEHLNRIGPRQSNRCAETPTNGNRYLPTHARPTVQHVPFRPFVSPLLPP